MSAQHVKSPTGCKSNIEELHLVCSHVAWLCNVTFTKNLQLTCYYHCTQLDVIFLCTCTDSESIQCEPGVSLFSQISVKYSKMAYGYHRKLLFFWNYVVNYEEYNSKVFQKYKQKNPQEFNVQFVYWPYSLLLIWAPQHKNINSSISITLNILFTLNFFLLRLPGSPWWSLY